MHAACLEAEIPGSVSKFESVQGATIACVTPGTRSDGVRFAHSHAQRLMTLCIYRRSPEHGRELRSGRTARRHAHEPAEDWNSFAGDLAGSDKSDRPDGFHICS